MRPPPRARRWLPEIRPVVSHIVPAQNEQVGLRARRGSTPAECVSTTSLVVRHRTYTVSPRGFPSPPGPGLPWSPHGLSEMIELLRGEGGSCGLGFKINPSRFVIHNLRIHVVNEYMLYRSGVQITPSPSPPPPSPPPSPPPPPAVASAPPRLAGPRRRASAHRDRPGKAPSLRTEPESLPSSRKIGKRPAKSAAKRPIALRGVGFTRYSSTRVTTFKNLLKPAPAPHPRGDTRRWHVLWQPTQRHAEDCDENHAGRQSCSIRYDKKVMAVMCAVVTQPLRRCLFAGETLQL